MAVPQSAFQRSSHTFVRTYRCLVKMVWERGDDQLSEWLRK